jgi:hypothetical protein
MPIPLTQQRMYPILLFIERGVLVTTFLTWERKKGDKKGMRIQKPVASALIDAK